MKRIHTKWAVLLSLALLTVSLPVPPAKAAVKKAPDDPMTGEIRRTSEEICLTDGRPTGGIWTQIDLNGHYGSDKTVHVASFDLSDPHLSFEVIPCGEKIVDQRPLDRAAEDYTRTHDGQTLLAAVNGDMWMTKVHSGPAMSRRVLRTTRGVLIIDGEIWASQQLDAENACATNEEKGRPAGQKATFGVTDTNQPLIGLLDITVTVTVNGQSVTADGLNRLPAPDSLIVYNHRVNSSNYALDDAFEIVLQAKDPAFRPGGTQIAEVRAIYPPDSPTRPAIGPDTILLTARGKRLSDVETAFRIGDTVELQTTLTDRCGHTDLWQRVHEAIGGHLAPLIDGQPYGVDPSTSEYNPTTMIGFRHDGTVVMLTVTSSRNKRAGLRPCQSQQFCTELGLNSVCYLDGGGSTTFVTLDEGQYTVRNYCSDGGVPRSVILGAGIVWNDQPVLREQGSLDYIRVPVDLSDYPSRYLDGALLPELIGETQHVETGYDAGEKAFLIRTATGTVDPFAMLNFGKLSPLNVTEFPFLVFRLKTDRRDASRFALYYAAGRDQGASPDRVRTFAVGGEEDGWQYVTVDMSKESRFRGNLNQIRLDVFDSVWTEAGQTMYIGAVVFCRNAEEAAKVPAGWAPEGAITDYLAYVESLKHPTDPETEPPTDPETEPPTDPETEPPTDPETEPPTDPETEPPTDPETEPPTDPETEPPTDPETEPPTDPETEPPTDPETEPPTDPESDPPTDPETEPPTDPETEPPTDPETEPPTDPETEPPTDPETEPPTDPETEPPTDPETESPTDPETEPPTDPETESPTDPETESPTDPETEPLTDPETEPLTDPETEPPTDPETEPPTDPETEPPTDPETEPPTDPETEPPTDPETHPGEGDNSGKTGCRSALNGMGGTIPVLLWAAAGLSLVRRKNRHPDA